MTQKTTLPKKSELEKNRKWHFLDATDKVLGRLASRAASLLTGKNKRDYTPSLDCGDFVVITNAAKVKVTGNKAEQKYYFRHSGYPKGAKTIPFKRQMEKDPTKVIFLAVKRMIDKNRLRDKRMKRLKIFAGTQEQFKEIKR